jgi:hypothetical protein
MNQDTNGDGKCDLNCDTDGDGFPDINIDIDGDKVCDLNCDNDGDGKCDLNCDTDGDGKPDTNIDTDGDGKPDKDIDKDGDGKPDTNVDKDGDGNCDLNCDVDKDGVCDYNCDTNGDGICDYNCTTTFEKNANLKSLTINNYALSPVFNENITSYTIRVGYNTNKVNIKAVPANPKATVTGDGEVVLTGSTTYTSVVVTAEDGTKKTYNITIIKSDKPGTSEGGDDNDKVEIENGSLIVNYTKDINVNNIYPKWRGSQTFTITNKSKSTVTYNINLKNVINTFNSDDFKYTLFKDNVVLVKQTPAPRKDGSIYQNLVLAAGESATFELRFEFVETGKPQDADIGVRYSSKVEISIVSVN